MTKEVSEEGRRDEHHPRDDRDEKPNEQETGKEREGDCEGERERRIDEQCRVPRRIPPPERRHQCGWARACVHTPATQQSVIVHVCVHGGVDHGFR